MNGMGIINPGGDQRAWNQLPLSLPGGVTEQDLSAGVGQAIQRLLGKSQLAFRGGMGKLMGFLM